MTAYLDIINKAKKEEVLICKESIFITMNILGETNGRYNCRFKSYFVSKSILKKWEKICSNMYYSSNLCPLDDIARGSICDYIDDVLFKKQSNLKWSFDKYEDQSVQNIFFVDKEDLGMVIELFKCFDSYFAWWKRWEDE